MTNRPGKPSDRVVAPPKEGSEVSPQLRPLPRDIIERSDASDTTDAAKQEFGGSTEAEAQTVVPEARRSGSDIGGLIGAAWGTHTYVNEYVRFADAKAGVVVGIASAILAALYTADVHHAFVSTPRTEYTLSTWISILSFGLLALSVLAAVVGILPRPGRDSTPNIISWPDIAAFGTASDFEAAARRANQQQILSALLSHLYILATLCRRKYWWIKWSILLGLTGAVLGSVMLLRS